MAAFHQLRRLPRTLIAIRRILREDCSFASADEHLWAFRGFHLEASDPHYRARSWQKAAIAAIGPGDVVEIPAGELAFMMHVAMEIEDPIVEYSQQNGEGFRLLLPNLGRFMGRNDEESAYAKQHGLAWCESPWCAEERRHGNLFAKLIERIAATAPPRDNPNQPRAVTADEEDALRHLMSRQAAEWASSSTYAVMAAHATGHLHTMLRNVERDEVKHLCVLAAADRYLLGPRPWRRMRELIAIGLENYRGQRRARSGGQAIGSNPVTAMEVVAAHLLLEYYLRRWLATLPVSTLITVFETPSNLQDLGGSAPGAEEVARMERRKERRIELARWRTAARRRALRARDFEEMHRSELAELEAGRFDGFHGAEAPGSPRAGALRRRIARIPSRRIRTSLRGQLRDYQIRNNRHIMAREQARKAIR